MSLQPLIIASKVISIVAAENLEAENDINSEVISHIFNIITATSMVTLVMNADQVLS